MCLFIYSFLISIIHVCLYPMAIVWLFAFRFFTYSLFPFARVFSYTFFFFCGCLALHRIFPLRDLCPPVSVCPSVCPSTRNCSFLHGDHFLVHLAACLAEDAGAPFCPPILYAFFLKYQQLGSIA